MIRKRTIAVGCLLTVSALSVFAVFAVYRVVSAVSAITIQVPAGMNQFYGSAISAVVDNGTPEQKLDVLKLLQEADKTAQDTWVPSIGPRLEPLLSDANDEVRASAVACFKVIDPSALVRASGPPPPAMPRESSGVRLD